MHAGGTFLLTPCSGPPLFRSKLVNKVQQAVPNMLEEVHLKQ